MKVIKTKLNETNRYNRMKKALFGDKSGKIRTFAIISPDNPLGWKDSTEEEFIKKYNEWSSNPVKYNKNARDEMKTTVLLHKIKDAGDTALRYSGAKYTPLLGSYGDTERSYMIFNITDKDAKAIASSYGQESFFFGKVYEDGPHIAYYETTNACKSYKLVEISNTVYDMSDAEDFFSKYGAKFKIGLELFGDAVEPVVNQDEFEKSLEEDRTFQSRAMHRRHAYKKDE